MTRRKLGTVLLVLWIVFSGATVYAQTAPAPSEETDLQLDEGIRKAKRRAHKVGSPIKVDLEKKRIFTDKIRFPFGSDKPDKASRRLLANLAKELTKRSELKVRIEGHTDSIGTDQKNLEVSQRRADQVKAILVHEGVAPERLEAVGRGDQAPIASNATAKGQEKNRRVEFHLVDVNAVSSSPVTPPIPTTPIAPVQPPTPTVPSVPTMPPAPQTPIVTQETNPRELPPVPLPLPRTATPPVQTPPAPPLPSTPPTTSEPSPVVVSPTPVLPPVVATPEQPETTPLVIPPTLAPPQTTSPPP